MLENILVPLDGSPRSEAALPYAVALAKRAGAMLTLVRVAHSSALTLPNDHGAAQLHALDEAEEYVNVHADALRRREGLRVLTGVPFGGTATEWIVEEASLRHADLIVMATHDRHGPDHWLHGSVAEKVVSRSPAPVLIVRVADGMLPVETFDWRQPVLVVPLDGSGLAEQAVPVAVNLARALKGRIVLIRVVPELEVEARDYLDGQVDRLAGVEVPVERVVRTGDPATAIALLAHEQRAAAVVMATHGRTGLARTMLGSVAGQVVHSSSSPVILFRPAELQPATEAVEMHMEAIASV